MLPQVVALEKLQEGKLTDHCHAGRSLSVQPYQPPSGQISSPSKLLMKCVSIEEMAVCHHKGLCYHCNENWMVGHHCKPHIQLFIADGDADSDPTPNSDFSLDSQALSPFTGDTPQLSLNAMLGMPTLVTFCFYDRINHHRVTILVDGDSTHNFVQNRVAKFLDLPTTLIPTFRVVVGYDGILYCTSVCSQVPLVIQGHTFTPNLYTLTLNGATIILGIQWLTQLGPVTTNYTTLSMSFYHLGLPTHFHVDVPFHPASA